MPSVTLVIATKDRQKDLRKTLRSIAGQTVRPQQVVIVDASNESVEATVREVEDLNVCYKRHWPPSAAAQRNAGLAAVKADAELIGFMDDDIVLEPDAMQRMLVFWESASGSVGGAAFNCLNTSPSAMKCLKQCCITTWLDLYSKKIGGVASSGWQAVVGMMDRTTRVRWLPSTASVWRREVLQKHAFDEYFDGYSYLEDLDFSYSVGKQYELYIVADAGFRHYPGEGGRIRDFDFGRIEVRNRLYFVRKHGLSVWRCYFGMGIRLLMTLGTALIGFKWAGIKRAAGNVVQLCTVSTHERP